MTEDGCRPVTFKVPEEFFEVLVQMAESRGQTTEEYLEDRVAPLLLLVEHLGTLLKNPQPRRPIPGYL